MFSSYATPQGMQLAAIVVDSSEEMRDREEQNLQQQLKANKITASVVSHELRNLCGAISLLCSHLNDRHSLAADEDFQGITSLLKGVEKISSLEMQSRSEDRRTSSLCRCGRCWTACESSSSRNGGTWVEMSHGIFQPEIPPVVADPSGLLQAFLNLAKNSHRAVQKSSLKTLRIEVQIKQDKGNGSFSRFRTGDRGCLTDYFNRFNRARTARVLGSTFPEQL